MIAQVKNALYVVQVVDRSTRASIDISVNEAWKEGWAILPCLGGCHVLCIRETDSLEQASWQLSHDMSHMGRTEAVFLAYALTAPDSFDFGGLQNRNHQFFGFSLRTVDANGFDGHTPTQCKVEILRVLREAAKATGPSWHALLPLSSEDILLAASGDNPDDIFESLLGVDAVLSENGSPVRLVGESHLGGMIFESQRTLDPGGPDGGKCRRWVDLPPTVSMPPREPWAFRKDGIEAMRQSGATYLQVIELRTLTAHLNAMRIEPHAWFRCADVERASMAADEELVGLWLDTAPNRASYDPAVVKLAMALTFQKDPQIAVSALRADTERYIQRFCALTRYALEERERTCGSALIGGASIPKFRGGPFDLGRKGTAAMVSALLEISVEQKWRGCAVLGFQPQWIYYPPGCLSVPPAAGLQPETVFGAAHEAGHLAWRYCQVGPRLGDWLRESRSDLSRDEWISLQKEAEEVFGHVFAVEVAFCGLLDGFVGSCVHYLEDYFTYVLNILPRTAHSPDGSGIDVERTDTPIATHFFRILATALVLDLRRELAGEYQYTREELARLVKAAVKRVTGDIPNVCARLDGILRPMRATHRVASIWLEYIEGIQSDRLDGTLHACLAQHLLVTPYVWLITKMHKIVPRPDDLTKRKELLDSTEKGVIAACTEPEDVMFLVHAVQGWHKTPPAICSRLAAGIALADYYDRWLIRNALGGKNP